MVPAVLNGRCFQRLAPVDIGWVLPLLAETAFINTGGTNGWIAKPEWLDRLFTSVHLDGAMTFAVARMLPAGQGIPPHIDLWENIPNMGRRYHVPLVSDPNVMMCWPDDHVRVYLEPGWLWEVCFTKLHEVVNLAPTARIHAHFNVV